jgi:hypothetical protein
MEGFPKHYTGDELNRANQSSSTGKANQIMPQYQLR